MIEQKEPREYQFSEMRKKLAQAHSEIIQRRQYRGARESDVVDWLAEYVEQNFVDKSAYDSLKQELEDSKLDVKRFLELIDKREEEIEILKSKASQFESTLLETMKLRDAEIKRLIAVVQYYADEKNWYDINNRGRHGFKQTNAPEMKMVIGSIDTSGDNFVGGHKAREALKGHES